jgi:hypothetical protein
VVAMCAGLGMSESRVEVHKVGHSHRLAPLQRRGKKRRVCLSLLSSKKERGWSSLGFS